MNRKIGEIEITTHHEINRAERFIEEVCDYYNVGSEYFANIMLGTVEAARFLISKKMEEQRPVIRITAEKSNQGITFTLQDHSANSGTKDSEDVLDKAIEDHNLSREIFIIKSLADYSKFEKTNQKIVLGFNITSIRSDRYMGRVSELQGYFKNKPVTTKKSNA